MAHRIEISGAFSQDELLELHSYCRNRFRDELELYPPPLVFGMDVDTFGTISNVVGLIASLISLCLQLRQPKTDPVWSFARLKSYVATECAHLGIHDVQIVSIKNFNALLETSEEPCSLKLISAANNTELDMHIFNDGSKYIIKVVHN